VFIRLQIAWSVFEICCKKICQSFAKKKKILNVYF
jgi:hypothetical protein